MDFEQLRRQFLPEDLRVLFVGESRPAGGTFFYAGNTHLCRYMEQAFAASLGRHFASLSEFREFFRSLGCYLDDLCLIPVNSLSRADRRDAHGAGIDALATRIREFEPRAIVSVMKATEPHVRRAMTKSRVRADFYSLPFPASGHQTRYVVELTSVVSALKASRVLLEPKALFA